MMAGMALASLVAGMTAGWVLRSAFIKAEISRILKQTQREVNYWERETARAEYISDQLARQLAAHSGYVPNDRDWSQKDGH